MKISCVTITQLSRIDLLKKSLWSYSQQTFAIEFLELIIVHHDGFEGTKAFQQLIERLNIKANIIEAPILPLGALRNIGIEKANGNIICQWDDDDFYHPNRLKVQSSPLMNGNYIATTLDSQFFWFSDRGTLYIRRGGKEGIHGSIMFRKIEVLKYNSKLYKGEDSEFIHDILNLKPGGIYRIDGHPELFVRTYHGRNTWSFEHHNNHIKQAFNMEWLIANKTKIEKWIAILQIPTVKVCDNNNKIAFSC